MFGETRGSMVAAGATYLAALLLGLLSTRADAKVVGAGPIVETFCEGQRDCIDASLELQVVGGVDIVDVGNTLSFEVVLVSPVAGIQGWSYGVSHDPSFASIIPDSVTLTGTDAGAALVAPFFDVTRAVSGGADFPPGFISAVVLSFVADATLTPGRNTLARVSYEVIGGGFGGFFFEDNVLRNAPSPPVGLNFTVGGNARFPSRLVHQEVSLPPLPREPFWRGDTDGNFRLDIIDAMSIVWFVAGVRGPRVSCLDALDADDDGRVTFIDAVPILNRLFRGGPPLPWPGEFCDEDPTPDGLDCAEWWLAC